MDWPLVNLKVSSALAAVLWVVQLVVYPAFASIDPGNFCAWHRRYTRTIGCVVAPLILIQAAAVAHAWGSLSPAPGPLVVQSLAILVAWGVTAAVSVPLHHRLGKSRDPVAMQRLVRTNWWRTLAWSLAALAAWRLAA